MLRARKDIVLKSVTPVAQTSHYVKYDWFYSYFMCYIPDFRSFYVKSFAQHQSKNFKY